MSAIARTYSRKAIQKATASPIHVPNDRAEILSNTLVEFNSEHGYIQEISKLWKESQDRFLTIGRYLLRAKMQFPKRFEQEVVARLPFNRSVAHQLRCVAEAVHNNRLTEDEMPRSYSAAYRLTILTEAEMGKAKEEGLVQPETSRSTIDTFIKTIRHENLDVHAQIRLLDDKRARIERQISRMQEELNEIEEQIRTSKARLIEGKPSSRKEGLTIVSDNR